MLILVGPSASGKTEVVKMLINQYGMQKLVTYTTRSMRPLEVDGIDYHFVTKEYFLQKKMEGFFLETVEYNNNFYGTAFEDLANNKVVILEPSGVKNYLKQVPDLIKICYLKTPVEYRIKRMLARGDSADSIKWRVESDDLIFNEELEQIANWTILSTDISITDLTKQIYKYYEPYL